MIEFQSDVHTIVHFFPVLLVLLKFFLHVYFLKYTNNVWIFYVLSVVHNSLTRITLFDYFFFNPLSKFFFSILLSMKIK